MSGINGSRHTIEIDGINNKIIMGAAGVKCSRNVGKDDNLYEETLIKFQKGKVVLDERCIDMMYVDYDNENSLVISSARGFLITMKHSEKSQKILSGYMAGRGLDYGYNNKDDGDDDNDDDDNGIVGHFQTIFKRYFPQS